VSVDRDANGLRPDSKCEQILARVHEFLDHELDEASFEAIRAHLEACEHCLDDYDVEMAVKKLVNRCCRGQHAPPQLRVTILTSITRWRAN
jgi:anti-sigma factor (TIGR02949 family)